MIRKLLIALGATGALLLASTAIALAAPTPPTGCTDIGKGMIECTTTAPETVNVGPETTSALDNNAYDSQLYRTGDTICNRVFPGGDPQWIGQGLGGGTLTGYQLTNVTALQNGTTTTVTDMKKNGHKPVVVGTSFTPSSEALTGGLVSCTYSLWLFGAGTVQTVTQTIDPATPVRLF